MYESLLNYCYNTKKFRNYAFVCLFKEIFVVEYKRLNYWIFGIQPDWLNEPSPKIYDIYL